MGFCEKYLNARAENLGCHREQNRHAAFMWPSCRKWFFALFNIPFRLLTVDENTWIALFWAQILHAIAANTRWLQPKSSRTDTSETRNTNWGQIDLLKLCRLCTWADNSHIWNCRGQWHNCDNISVDVQGKFIYIIYVIICFTQQRGKKLLAVMLNSKLHSNTDLGLYIKWSML